MTIQECKQRLENAKNNQEKDPCPMRGELVRQLEQLLKRMEKEKAMEGEQV